jgi:hypothetical protein
MTAQVRVRHASLREQAETVSPFAFFGNNAGLTLPVEIQLKKSSVCLHDDA